MKLRLESMRARLPKWIWLALIVVCCTVMLSQFPVRWLSEVVISQTGCRVMLEQPAGTLWQGSAALAFSEPNLSGGGCKAPMSVTERFHWETNCQLHFGSCQSEIQFSALDKTQLIRWGVDGVMIVANEVNLPANVLEGLGNPWNSLRPRGELVVRWTDLNIFEFSYRKISKTKSSGIVRIIITNLISPISPIKPLGSYEIDMNLTPGAWGWSLSTTSGPLLLKGKGGSANQSGTSFSGEASASPDAQDSLVGLLSLVGQKEGDIYRFKF